jgi:hypothetical protein
VCEIKTSAHEAVLRSVHAPDTLHEMERNAPEPVSSEERDDVVACMISNPTRIGRQSKPTPKAKDTARFAIDSDDD